MLVNESSILRRLSHRIGKPIELLSNDEIIEDVIFDIVLPTFSAYFPAYEHITITPGLRMVDPNNPSYYSLYKLPKSVSGMPWIDVGNFYLSGNHSRDMGGSIYGGSFARTTMVTNMMSSYPYGDMGILTDITFEAPDMLRRHPMSPSHHNFIVKMMRVKKLTEIKPLRFIMFEELAVAETKIHIYTKYKHLLNENSTVAGTSISPEQIQDLQSGFDERESILEILAAARPKSREIIEEVLTATANL